MIKPPKTPLLAAIVAVSVGCKGADQTSTVEPIGQVAAPPQEPDTEEVVGVEAQPPEDVRTPEPIVIGKVALPDAKPEGTKVGTVAKPQQHQIGREARPITPYQDEAAPAMPVPKPPEGDLQK